MKNALILGISGTLGQAISKKLAGMGYKVYGGCRDVKAHKELIEDKSVEIFDLNMKQITSVDAFYEKIRNIKFDFITNTIANPCAFDKFEKMKIETFEDDFKVNFINFVYLLQKIIPNMNYGSNIIFVLTNMIHHPKSYLSSYISSKYALFGLMKCLAIELGNKGIRVNSVSPGMMDTKFTWNLNIGGKVSKMPENRNQQFVDPNKVVEEILKIISSQNANGMDFEVRI